MTVPAWQNGHIVDISSALIPAGSPAILSARAVFDGCRIMVHKHDDEPSAFTISMPRHVERLQYSCRTLRIALPYTAKQLMGAAADVICALRPAEDMGLRWFVTEVDEGAKQAGPIVTVFARSLAGYTKAEPYRINFARCTRWVGHGIPYSAKTMAHYAASRRETLFARASGFDDCLFVNQFGNVTESPRANFLFLTPREIHSPLSEDGALAGLTRDSFRAVLRQRTALRWVDRSVGVGHLASYVGVLMLSSSLGVVPVEQLGPYRYGTAESQALANLWQSALRDPHSFFTSAIDEFVY